MRATFILLLSCFLLIHSFGFGQVVDLTPYAICKQGNFVGLTEGLGDLPDTEPGVTLAEMVYDGSVYIPDSINGFALTVLNYPYFGMGYMREVRLPETLTYLYGDFGSNLRSFNIPKNLYYFYVGGFGELDSIALPIPEKENHRFLGWKKSDVDTLISGGSTVKTSSGEYSAHFEYQLDEPYVLKKEDVLFIDGNLKECYYRGAKDIIVPSSFCGHKVESINGNQFDMAFGNQGLESVVFELGFEDIGGFAFNQIAHIELPEGGTGITHGAFRQNELSAVIIPSSVIRIESGAFSMNHIAKVHFNSPSNLNYIGGFSDNWISDLLLPSSLDTIARGAFAINRLKEVVVPDKVKVIGMSAFSKNKIERLVLPESLTFIGANAFQNNRLADVKVPNSIRKLHESTFSDNKIAKLQLPKSLEYIGAACFKNNQLSMVAIPSQVTFIGEDAFSGNPFLASAPRLPKPQIIGKSFLYWKGEVLIEKGKVERTEQCNSGDIIRDGVRYTAVFEE
ncbi:leucine-rich repeat domain-containing protein [Geofilum rhodophaeum]|uniref:leucine-rich repeat domain-containing protein n=1 Tax=Geofilum rhodophaeum TaxID=1965019 RepID=UPI000B52376A|nr:leucine-rich repeat domain-containing protein [Geofilum rhodophaeum]